MQLCTLFVILIVSALTVNAAIDSDLITSLPGFGQTPTKQYSGLIPVDDAKTIFLHYWFVESSGNPATDPVVVWLNGGPGCSSLEGYLFELGPLHFTGNFDSTGVPTLEVNPYSWSNIANVIFIESPAGVGFSFAVNGSTTTSDDITAANNYGFLLNWFASFSEYANNDFFVTGESYAGMYVPTLADRILVGNAAGKPKINLKGFAVGNAVNGADYDTSVPFYWGLGMFSQVTYERIIKYCGSLQPTNVSSDCQSAMDQAMTEVDQINNIYDVYDTCPQPVTAVQPRVPLTPTQEQLLARGADNQRYLPKTVGAPQCILPNVYGTQWFNFSSVRKALHVDTVNLQSWGLCYGIDYHANHGSLLGQYPSWAKQLRILVYSGDVDGCVPHVFTEQWTTNLGFPIKTPFRPWTLNDQVMGYAITFDVNDFTFLTVKGAGHMVPQTRPPAALAMFTRFIKNQPYE